MFPGCSPGASEPEARHHICPVLVLTQDLTATAKVLPPLPHEIQYALCPPHSANTSCRSQLPKHTAQKEPDSGPGLGTLEVARER